MFALKSSRVTKLIQQVKKLEFDEQYHTQQITKLQADAAKAELRLKYLKQDFRALLNELGYEVVEGPVIKKIRK